MKNQFMVLEFSHDFQNHPNFFQMFFHGLRWECSKTSFAGLWHLQTCLQEREGKRRC